MININLKSAPNYGTRIIWIKNNLFHRSNDKPTYMNTCWHQTWTEGKLTKGKLVSYFPYSCQAKEIK